MPRCQDLPPHSFLTGILPPHCQPWVVSYSWSAHLHSCPGGAKIKEISAALVELGAKASDAVFFDMMSLWQGSAAGIPELYKQFNPQALVTKPSPATGSEPAQVDLPGRSKLQTKEFRFALFETTRLYAFAGGVLPDGTEVLGCKVLILPDLEDPKTFPEKGALEYRSNENCEPAREEWHSAWGYSKSKALGYEHGGWTCAEYAVARASGTIANMHHERVQRIEAVRSWPANVSEYSEMMDENSDTPVIFTKRGDREAVRFNFYKYTYHFSGKSAEGA